MFASDEYAELALQVLAEFRGLPGLSDRDIQLMVHAAAIAAAIMQVHAVGPVNRSPVADPPAPEEINDLDS